MPTDNAAVRWSDWVGVLETVADTGRCAALLAPVLRAGDVVTLEGDLGAGKTVFARSVIQALHAGEEVPSPTFNLVLTYEPEDPGAPTIWHFDLYRLEAPEDAIELGIEEAFDDAISLVEWPARLEYLLPRRRIEITLVEGAHDRQRLIAIRVPEAWSDRFIPTFRAIGLKPARDREAAFFLACNGWDGAIRSPLAGDASFRRYERLTRSGERAVFMDAPPPREDVRPFLAISSALAGAGLSAPRVLAADKEAGFLLLEDLGDGLFSRAIAESPALERPLYEAAVDCLLVLHRRSPPEKISVDGEDYTVPAYDMARYQGEAALFVDWYLPALRGEPLSAGERREFLDLWRAALSLVEGVRDALTLRDYHADNLIWSPDRAGVGRVGLLDYQDAVRGHPAYDLVSLLEDARRDVPPALAGDMIDRYLAARSDLDEDQFRAACAVLGAQRNTKIIGIFTRLFARDGKPAYLDLIPRVWGLLERDLAHPGFAALKAWFDDAVPASVRSSAPEPARLWRLPKQAMILGAGLGARMRPLTETTPKPLIQVAGVAMLDRALDRLAAAGVDDVVVNVYHLPDRIRDHMARRADRLPLVRISDETGGLLESGGGVRKALDLLGSAAFFVLNGDMVWDDAGTDCLLRLAAAWDPERMDALLLVVATDKAMGYEGKGDFFLDHAGRLTRRGGADAAPYVFTGIQMLSPRLFHGAPDGPFSLNLIYDRALEVGRLHGLVHDGRWMHVGTPGAVEEASREFREA